MNSDEITSLLLELRRIANALDTIVELLGERLGKAPISSKSPPSSGKGRGK